RSSRTIRIRASSGRSAPRRTGRTTAFPERRRSSSSCPRVRCLRAGSAYGCGRSASSQWRDTVASDTLSRRAIVRVEPDRRELAPDGTPEPAAAERDDSEHARALATALAELAPEQRAVIVLRYLLDYTPGEIADLLELPRGTVNSRLRRGLDRLEAALREELS